MGGLHSLPIALRACQNNPQMFGTSLLGYHAPGVTYFVVGNRPLWDGSESVNCQAEV
jgi:hypothetical protein